MYIDESEATDKQLAKAKAVLLLKIDAQEKQLEEDKDLLQRINDEYNRRPQEAPQEASQ